MDAGIKDRAGEVVDAAREKLIGLSHRLHANPELGFEEHESSRAVAAVLESHGFDVTMGVAELETAFVAEAGSGPLVIGICAEYDALPGIGHACGHNVIAAAAVGAGIALAKVADDVGITVRVLGTPAEEGGGGKILMLERGAFDGIHAAMMVHPSPFEMPAMGCLAVQHFDVRYHGRSAHASAFPELGLNAADALTVAQVGIGLLRQHIGANDRIHGIVTDGGDAPNIVPERTAGQWYVRSATLAELAELYPRVRRCFEAGALATGTRVEFPEPPPAYSEFDHDPDLVAAYVRNARALGRVFPDLGAAGDRMVGSTDMANVSLHIPTIHPMIAIETDAVNHQPEFTAACATPSADRAVRDGALAMAWTAIDAAGDEELARRLTERSFDASRYEAPAVAAST